MKREVDELDAALAKATKADLIALLAQEVPAFADSQRARLDYEIEDVDERRLTKTAQIRMCGNSVPPQIAEALVRANIPNFAIAPDIEADAAEDGAA